MALEFFNRADRLRILAAASRKPVRGSRQTTGKGTAVGCSGCGLGNDFVSAAYSWAGCRGILVGKKHEEENHHFWRSGCGRSACRGLLFAGTWHRPRGPAATDDDYLGERWRIPKRI